MPPEAEIEATMDRVGMAHIGIRPDALMRRADVSIDLSAIAKGYGVDRIAETLEAAGVTDYLVEIGGELRASGTNERGTPWRIAIERPDVGARVPYTTVDIRNAAIATSGDYRNYFEVDGERYSHLIDPTTGRPVEHNLASVTVVAPTCAEADGLATAISVMGAKAGLAMAQEKELAVFVIIKGSEGFETRSSPAFQAYLKQG
ncbi:MAG: FAD:protein FMN transferase [Gammaproteobacteria bacterium]|nr:FAD:protein FMN transferase [Gammaproteobacteria bacterium]